MLKQPKGREVIYGFSDFELVSIFWNAPVTIEIYLIHGFISNNLIAMG